VLIGHRLLPSDHLSEGYAGEIERRWSAMLPPKALADRTHRVT
jgi:hypothetical protein